MSSLQRGHPLPTPPPGQQQPYEPPQQRQRSKSSFSLRSDKSHKSSNSVPKIDLHETAQEKAAHKLTSKADPRLAMEEAEPSAVAARVATSLAPLRAIQHLDANGNPIADPDRSNPTRSRWERPLDTIRAFEAAIDGNYSRKSYMRTESADSSAAFNRRSGYYAAGSHVGAMTPRFPQENQNGGRSNNFRPDSYVENKGNNGYQDNISKPSNGYYPNRARYPRTASEPQFNNSAGVYPAPGNQQSYETVTTASGSGSSGDPFGYSTDPSSENSSLDRIQPPGVPEHASSNGMYNYGASQNNQMLNYGSNGYGGSNYSSSGYGGYPGKPGENGLVNAGYQGQNGGPPPLPRKESVQGPPRVPIKLDRPAGVPQGPETSRPMAGERRKSWFGLKRKG